MDFTFKPLEKLTNKIVVSPRYHGLGVITDIACPEDMAYMIDSKGNVHYFKNIGQNLAGIKEDN